MHRSTVPIVSVVCLLAAGCATHKSEPVAQESKPAPAPKVSMPAPTIADGRQRSSYAFPTGHLETSVLLVERDLPAEIITGEEFSYSLKLTNVNHLPVKGVMLRDDCASQMTLVGAEPMPVDQKPPFVWSLGDLNPGETRTVRVTGKTTATEPFTSCATATWNSSLCLTAPVVHPALRLTMTAPTEVTPCDTIPIHLTLLNTGTGTARDVRLAYPLPEGWTTTDGKTTAQLTLDSLAANQSHEFTVNAKASKTGDFTSRATATGAPGLKAESAPMPTAVRQAILGVEAQGPEHVYAGRPATFKFTVSNTGNGPATAATLEAPVPVGAKFVSATEGGTLRAGSVVWNLQTLPVKASKVFAMTLEPGSIGSLDGAATAKAYCATAARDVTSVSVLGIPALLLEVTDLSDPIEVGRETIYEIVITNQGSAPATNVRINAALEATQQFVSATGGTAKASNGVVTFDPIPTIAPKGKTTLRLTVKCVEEGDTRFKVSMTGDELTRPVEETESTHIYR